jgi:mono/diheme cytochrome c family protein
VSTLCTHWYTLVHNKKNSPTNLRARFTIILALFSILPVQARLTPEQRAKLPPPAADTIDFKRDIQPVIEKSCVKCHGRGRNKGGFVFETRDTLLKGGDSGPAVIAGNSAESLLIELVSGLDPDNVMPAKGTKLTLHEVGLMRAWIDQGLKWDSAITFAKKPAVNLQPRKPELPKGNAKANPVDRLLAPYFKEHNVRASKPVDDRVFARRAYLDTIGLLPTALELNRFVENRSSNKRELLVHELLGRENDYPQHWMTFWNDMLRNDYRGAGYIDGGRKQITGWLYSALATNMPFDQFVAKLINPSVDSEGFVKGIVWRGVVNASQTPEMQAAQNISQVFMGVNLKCASCHDSFINDWTLADSYGMASIYAEQPLELVQCDKPLGKTAPVKFLFPELGALDTKASKPDRVKRLAEVITSREDGRLSRTIVNRLWARFLGRGLVEPVDDMEQAAWNQDVLDWLAADLVDHNYDLKRTIETILTSRAYQMPAVAATESSGKDFVFRGPQLRRLTAEEFVDAVSAITGVWNGDAVPDLNFTAAGQKLDPALETLTGKPRWIWNDSNAAAKAPAQTVYFRKTIQLPSEAIEARVVVTCDNAFKMFVNGKEAASSKDFTKPRVADIRKYLKPGANVIAIAATNDEAVPGQANVDQGNPAGLFVYARLRTKDGTHDLGSDASWKATVTKVDGWEKADFDDAQWTASSDLGGANAGPWGLGQKLARIVANQDYTSNCRAVLANADPLMTALGRPNREQVMTTRASAATTLQALELTNGATLANRIKAGAENLALEKDTKKLVDRLYLSALGRKPTITELSIANEMIGAKSSAAAVEDLLWAVCMLPEFQLIQ